MLAALQIVSYCSAKYRFLNAKPVLVVNMKAARSLRCVERGLQRFGARNTN